MTDTTAAWTPPPRVAFHMPVKPYSVIDLINRRGAATGSMRNAQLCSAAEYNGHPLGLSFNDYRGYYVGEFYWGERVVFARSKDVVEAVRASLAEYARQGRGAYLEIAVKPEDAAAVREAYPDLTEGALPDIRSCDWWTWKHAEVGPAVSLHQDHLLLRARDLDHYHRLQGRVPAPEWGPSSYRIDREVSRAEWEKVRGEPLPA